MTEIKKNPLKVIILLGVFIAIGAGFALFYPLDEVQAPALPIETEHSYTAESWKTLIAPECQRFFDGCNSCFKLEGSEEVGCTKMYCEQYEQPKCLDEENTAIKNTKNVPICDENWTEQCGLEPIIESEAITETSGNNIPIKKISREEAKKLILNGEIISVFQRHNLELQLKTKKESFLTIEPKIDEVFELIQACGDTCSKMQLATE